MLYYLLLLSFHFLHLRCSWIVRDSTGSQPNYFHFPSRGAALVNACETSAVRVAMPTLLDEAMQTAMKRVTDLQNIPRSGGQLSTEQH